ncbi:ATP-dependent DNA helicase [Trichonephila inaurata madagascariensis]|uniref:ATP-dependent DNA helicase n=1 Tax=Trichonephila inaurata madagascariensis TaxID=2747483 RepID=A0A8X6XSQ1_9ARAC|nr:ATP-dependent DNA helicase [Trichonephila inaurata madagascariensis]
MTTANIDIAEGLVNGAVAKLSHFELDELNIDLQVWLLFPNNVGVKARRKVAGYASAKEIGREMVPINHRSATAPLNQNRSIHAKRNHFPLKPPFSLTIHKLQGGTFDEIIYKYCKAHSQTLVKLVLSRVMAQEGIPIIPTDGCQSFYHVRRNSEAMLPLRNQFTKLYTVHLTTIFPIKKSEVRLRLVYTERERGYQPSFFSNRDAD